MTLVDIHIPVVAGGPTIPSDHAYLLYAAISRICPELHASDGVAIIGISGLPTRTRLLNITANSCLRLRAAHDLMPAVLQLAGKTITLGESTVVMGIPQCQLLRPRSNLYSRLVVIKGALEESDFRVSLIKQLGDLGINREPIFFKNRLRIDEKPMRKTVRIKGKEIVGYPIIFNGLTPQESLKLQEFGLGGRRKMGCGCFVGMGR